MAFYFPNRPGAPHPTLTPKERGAEDSLRGGLGAFRSHTAGIGGEAGVGDGEGHPVEDVDRHEDPRVVDEEVEDEAHRESQQREEEGVSMTQPLDDATCGEM